ncbi:cationic amino acid transporter 4-like [Patiria miniata]|uniref:Cationic amino acid transporter C-terminal domain-containing protein n=1 Tax=Patiria miniata TaxID=46514 RepID=A0A914BA19_PATMI|nr:cationic amino acid transporter 4-like [Patiria miniata]
MGLVQCFREMFSSSTRRKPVQRDAIPTPLHRCLGVVDLTLLGVGSMIGSGSFLLPGQVSGVVAGPAALLVFFLSGMLASLSGLCYIECALQLPGTGASYLYAYATLGEMIAFLTGWSGMAARIVALAFIGQVWSAYLDDALGGSIGNATVQFVLGGQEWNAPLLGTHPDFIAGLLILVSGGIISLGTNVFSKANNLFMITTLLTLMLVFIVAMIHADFSLVTEHGFAPRGVGFDDIVGSAILAYAGYAGIEAIALAAEEAKDQSKDLLIGLVSALGISILVYMTGVLSVTVLTEYSNIDLKTPFEAAFNDLDGLRWMKYIVAVGALCSITGGALNLSYAMTRFIYPMSRDGLLPSVLSRTNERTKTPLLANLLGTCICVVFAVLIDIKILIQTNSMLYTLETVIIIFAVTILRYRPPNRSDGYVELGGVDKADFKEGANEAHGRKNTTSDLNGLLKPKPETDTAETNATNELPKRPSWIHKGCAIILRWIREHTTRSVILSLCFHLIFEFLLVALLTFRMDDLLRVHDPGLILGIVVSSALTLVSCCPLLLLPQYTDDLPFKVPLMPFLPLIALLAAVILLLHFNSLVYVGVVVWLCLGLIVYFTYGMKQSVEATRQDVHLNDQ